MSKAIKTKEDIKTFEDACEVLGMDASIPNLSAMPESYQKPMLAHYKLCVITQAINTLENEGETWKPNWNDWDQYKYYPWFEMGSPSGGGFSADDCDYWYAASLCGSRLCFKTREAAKYAGKQFEALYKEYFVIE